MMVSWIEIQIEEEAEQLPLFFFCAGGLKPLLLIDHIPVFIIDHIPVFIIEHKPLLGLGNKHGLGHGHKHVLGHYTN